MKRFRTYHQNKTGMVPRESLGKLDAIRGTAGHKLMELASNGQLEKWRTLVGELFKSIPESVRFMQQKLCERAMLGWYRKRWPLIVQEYDVMSAEQSWVWKMAPDVELPFRLDRVLRSKSSGGLAIFDFKFIGSMDLNWRERHSHSDQTQLYIQGLKERSNELVEGMIYDAIIVGQWNSEKMIQKSPFVAAYKIGNSGVDADDYSPTYVAKKELVSIVEWDDKRWMNWAISTNVLDELYLTSGLLLPTSRILLATKESTIVAEREWDLLIYKLDECGNKYGYDSEEYHQLFESTVEKNPDACLQYGWEKKCEHYQACWVNPDDLSGYEPRKDHHQQKQEE
jgi:hypothetical protein